MAIITTKNNFQIYTITSKDHSTRASFIPEKGGAGCSLIMLDHHGERELLYLHDFFWNKEIPDLPGGWPFCFPICARLERMNVAGNYLYDGKIYNMPIHGFSWWLPWQVLEHTDDSLTLCLKDTDQSLKMYPFHFEVILKYIVSPNQLICEQTYHNKSQDPMPYYAGFHPYFLTPELGQGKEKVQLNYKPIRRFQYNERLTDLVGEQKLFHLPTTITAPEINEQLTQVSNNKLTQLIFPEQFKIEMRAEGVEDSNLFPYVQLYNMSEKPFFCIEPWMSFPNALNTVKGVRWLAPEQIEHGILTLKGTLS